MKLRTSLLKEATRYGDVQRQANEPLDRKPQRVQTPGQRDPSAPAHIFVPRLGREVRFEDWFWRELREGGYLQKYLASEKHRSASRLRAVARRMDGWQQNNKSDFRLKAAIPAREYFRWKKEDPDFWSDDRNLRSFKRDNPEAVIHV